MANAPLILAMDTALGGCSVAVVRGVEILAHAQSDGSGQQSRLLVPLMEEALFHAGIGYKDLTAVACTLGPGGFTGIRVGLSTARAVALAAGLPLIGLTTLEAMAAKTQLAGDVVAVIDAYRGEFYAQRFQVSGGIAVALSEPLLLEENALAPYAAGATVTRAPADARDVALLASATWLRGRRDFSAAPVYIRAPDAKLPLNAGLKYDGEPL